MILNITTVHHKSCASLIEWIFQCCHARTINNGFSTTKQSSTMSADTRQSPKIGSMSKNPSNLETDNFDMSFEQHRSFHALQNHTLSPFQQTATPRFKSMGNHDSQRLTTCLLAVLNNVFKPSGLSQSPLEKRLRKCSDHPISFPNCSKKAHFSRK